ncbi:MULTISPECIES: phage tail tape measure protein [unclassified Geobacillus]|uniref:phage tail tape measure protein n=1 Tax=unclassified Geobacillus TaxID=2642459 RepID=UPI0018EE5FFD|nr:MULTISPECIES: phage tail tape measure protein [unclassified Geobacillus]
MAETVRGINIVIGADTTKLGKALADVESKSKSIQSELRQVDRLLRFDPSNTTLLAQKQQLLAKQIENTSEKLNRLKSVQQQVDEQFRRGEISEGQYRAFQRELEKTEGQLRSLQNRLEETNGAINKHTTTWGRLQESLNRVGQNLRDVGQRMQNVGQSMAVSFGAATAAIGGALGFAVKKSMDFEAQIDRVGAVAGATPAEIKKLEKAALDLGASTSKSATEVAQGMEIMAAMGYNTNQILAAMPGIIAAAEASGEDMALVAETVSAALNAFGLEASEASRVADILAQAANDSAAGVQDMQYTFKYAAPIAKQLGISLEQLAAATEIMANNGIKGEQAGTTLRAALIRLSDPPREAANTLEALGVKITDANGKMLPFSNIIGQLAEKTKNMSNAQKLAALSTIFGTEAASGMLSVVEAGPQKLDQLTKSLQNSAGASQEAAAKMKDNLKGSLEELQGAFETAQITIGNALAPAIQKIAEALQGLINWFNNLSPSMQKFIAIGAAVTAVLTGIVAAIGIVIAIIGGAVNGFGALALAFGKVSGAIAKAGGMIGVFSKVIAFLTGPIGIAIAAITGLVAAGVAVYKNWDEIRAKAQEVFGGLSSFIAPAVQAFENFKNAVISAINGDFSRLGEIFAQIIPSIIAALVGGLPAVLITVSRFLPAIAETISNNTGAVTMAIQNVTNAIVNFLTTSFPQMVTAGVGIITNFVNGIVQSLPTIIQTTATIVQSLAQGISTTLPKLIETGTQVINTLVNAIVTSLPLIIQAGLQLIVQLVSGISQALPKIVAASVTVIQTLVGTLTKNLPLLITAGLTIIVTLVNAVVQNLPKIINAGIKILTSIVNGIVRALPQLVNMSVQLITKVAATLIQNLPKIIDAGVKILLAVVNGIVKVLPQLTNTAVNLIVKIASAIAQNLPKIIDAGVKILTALIKGIIQVLPQLVDAGIKLVVAVAKAIIDNLPKIIEAGGKILRSLSELPTTYASLRGGGFKRLVCVR